MSTRTRSIGLSIGAILAVLALIGCGGDDDAGGSEITTSSLSKAEYIKRADAVCKETEEGLQADYGTYVKEKRGQIASKPSEAEYAEFVRAVVVPNLEGEIERIRALGAPSGDEPQLEEFIRALERALKRVEEQPQLVSGGGKEVFESARRPAETYGFKVCA